jgi:site-specific DNA-adenine methylase
MLKSPFPWYGGKTLAAPLIWQALGNPNNYVDAFFGAGAPLFLRPHPPGVETINDKDAFVCNVFRALQVDPDAVAHWCGFPVNEAQLHAVHTWLVGQRETFTARLMGDPDYYDAQIAGRWLYGICAWIGRDWCTGKGPWQSVNGTFVKAEAGPGVCRVRPHLGGHGWNGGVHAHHARGKGLQTWFSAIQERLRHVRVCCGDWQRVLGPSVTFGHGLTGILLDPPYAAEEDRDPNLYREEDLQVAHAVRQWCLEHGQHPLLRIVLCGYDTTHDTLLAHGWRKVAWTAHGGYGNIRYAGDQINKYRERLWLSPACLTLESERQMTLFA